jgi:micrococcal nuclease
MKKLLALTLLLASTQVFAAKEKETVTYEWKVVKVLDGDTIKFEADWMPKPLKPEVSIRVLGIDTPEKKPRNKCEQEDALAQKASAFTKEAITKGKKIEVKLESHDKYGGRMLGYVVIDGKNLGDELITNGLARAYHGEAKSSWCE